MRDLRLPKRRFPHFSTILVVVIILLSIAVGIFVASNGIQEDERETRQYGNLTCVYNVTQDKIEDCSGG